MKNIFSNLDIAKLQGLVGSELSYVAGPQLWEFLNSDLIFVSAGSKKLSFQGDIFPESFEGFESDYSRIKLSEPTNSEVDAAVKVGAAYYFHSGEVINRVFVIRDLIRYIGSKRESWEYVTDSGVVFQLTGGALAVTKLGHHDEMLQVTYLDELSVGLLPVTVGHFESDLFQKYEFSRELIPLGSIR